MKTRLKLGATCGWSEQRNGLPCGASRPQQEVVLGGGFPMRVIQH